MSFSSVNTQYEDSVESDPALVKKKIEEDRNKKGQHLAAVPDDILALLTANKEKPLRVFPRWNTRRGNLAGLGVGRKACGHGCPRH